MKSKMLENAQNLLNKELDFYYEGRKYISLFRGKSTKPFMKNNNPYIVIFNVKATERTHQYVFLKSNNIGEISGYLQALANLINLGGEFALTQVENLMRGSLQNLKGDK